MGTIDTTYNLKEVLRSILFVAGEGVEKEYVAEKLGVSMKELEKAGNSMGMKVHVMHEDIFNSMHKI